MALGGFPAELPVEYAQSTMALENGDYHVKPCEPAVSARRRGSGLRFASANSSAARELLLRPRCLRASITSTRFVRP